MDLAGEGKVDNEEEGSSHQCQIPEEVGKFGIQTLGSTQEDGICLVEGQGLEMVVS